MAQLRTTLTFVAPLLLGTLVAEAQQLRFTTTAPGGIVATGNTLGLAKAVDDNGPGTADSIGTFISLDAASIDLLPTAIGAPWGANTTGNWSENGSEAGLTLPLRAEVLYAELLWGGSYSYVTDVSGSIDDAVTLSVGGVSTSVMPAAATALTIADDTPVLFSAYYYMRSADVTDFVTQNKSGTYALSGVAATEDWQIDSLSAAGWTLIVAYRDGSEPIRNLSIFVGGSFVDENDTQDYTVSGFCAPPSGVVQGKVVVSAIEGDANLSGDELLIAETAGGTFVNLSGPNNPVTNFFGSQINDRNGMLDTSGSFGTVNHNALTATNISGARQGWDVTTVAVSSVASQLVNDQTSAVIRTTTQGDSYAPIAVALEIDVKSPDFGDSTTEADTTLTQVGDTFELTATITNTGEADASNLAFVLDLDPSLSLDSYETDATPGDINGTAVTTPGLGVGVAAGDLGINETRTITLTLSVTGAPLNAQAFLIAPEWEHRFITCDGDPAIDEVFTPPDVSIPFQGENPTTGAGGSGGSGTTTAAGGNGNGGAGNIVGAGGSGSGNNLNDGDNIDEEGGCGCTTVGHDPAGTLSVSAFMLAGLFLARRRRRR